MKLLKLLASLFLLIGMAGASYVYPGDVDIKGDLAVGGELDQLGNLSNLTTTETSSVVLALNELKANGDTNETSINSSILSLTNAAYLNETATNTSISNLEVVITYPLSSTSANGTIFSPVAGDIQILGIVETHSVASTASEATSTLTIVKCTGTQTPASTGTSVMTNTFDLKGTPETMQSATLNADIGPTMLNTTERLGYRFNNPITSLAGGSVTIAYKRI